jgi:hypothetical protein
MRRMDCLLKEVYGLEAYNKRTNHSWESVAEKCNYVQTPEQGANECGFYIMKIACTFDGETYVDKLKPKDVSAFLLLLSLFIIRY